MATPRNLRSDVLRLRTEEKLSYRKIAKVLECSKSTVQYHCDNHNLQDVGEKRYPISEELKKRIKEYRKFHSVKKTMEAFNISKAAVIKHSK